MNDKNKDNDVVSLDLYRADRMIEAKLVDAFSFVPGIEEVVREMLDKAKQGEIGAPGALVDAIKDNLEAEVLRLMTEDEHMVSKLSDLVLELMGDEGIDFDDHEPFAAPDPLSPEEQAAHRLLHSRLSPEEQQDLGVALRQAQYGFEDTDSALANALSIAPTFYETHLVSASIFLRQGMLDEALEAAVEAEKHCPGSPQVAGIKAEILRHLGDGDGALACLDEAVRVNDWHVGLHRKRGYERFLNQKMVLAAQDFDWLIEHNPVGEDYFHLGNIRAAMEEYEAAVHAYENATRLDPYDAPTEANLGSALSKLGRTEQAMSSWGRATQLDPIYALPYSKRGAWCAASGLHSHAVAECVAALILAGEGWSYARETTICMELAAAEVRELPQERWDISPMLDIAMRLSGEGHSEFALEYLDALRQVLGSLPDALRLHFGILLYGAGYPEDAAETFEALVKHGDNDDALFYLGCTLLELDEPERAAELLERVVADEPPGGMGWTLDEAYSNLAEALVGSDPAKAQAYLDRVDPNNDDVFTMIARGRVSLALQDRDAAMSWADRAIEEDEFEGLAWLLRARVNVANQDDDEAIDDLIEVAALSPDLIARNLPAFERLVGNPDFDVLLHTSTSDNCSRVIIDTKAPEVWRALHQANFYLSQLHQARPGHVEVAEFRRDTDLALFLREPKYGVCTLGFEGPNSTKYLNIFSELEGFTDLATQLDVFESSTTLTDLRRAFVRLALLTEQPSVMAGVIDSLWGVDDGLLCLDLSHFVGPSVFEHLEQDARIRHLMDAAQGFPVTLVDHDFDEPWQDFHTNSSPIDIREAAWDAGLTPSRPVELEGSVAFLWVDLKTGGKVARLDKSDTVIHLRIQDAVSTKASTSLIENLALQPGRPDQPPLEPPTFEWHHVVDDDTTWDDLGETMLEKDMVFHDGSAFDEHWREWQSDHAVLRVVTYPNDVNVAFGTPGAAKIGIPFADIKQHAKSGSAAKRMRAMHQLGALGACGDDVDALLRQGSQDDDAGVRLASLEGAMACSNTLLTTLAEALKHDDNKGVRLFARGATATS